MLNQFNIDDAKYDKVLAADMTNEDFIGALDDTLRLLVFLRRTAEKNGFVHSQEYIDFEDAMNLISTLDLPDKY